MPDKLRKYEFDWDNCGGRAKFVRRSDGRVRYSKDNRTVFTLDRAVWCELVNAMEEEPLPVESLPIIGEIIGWRCWRWHHGHIWSLHREHIWMPHDTMQGHVGEVKGGIYAFKSMSRAMSEALAHGGTANPIVVGSVKLWGDAVEAENGWRAQYAKIVSLTEIVASKAARKRYGEKEPGVTETTTKVIPPGWRFWRGPTEISETVVIKPERILPLDTDKMLEELRNAYLGDDPEPE